MKINLLKVKMCKTKKGSSLRIILLSGPDGLEPVSTSVETVTGQLQKGVNNIFIAIDQILKVGRITPLQFLFPDKHLGFGRKFFYIYQSPWSFRAGIMAKSGIMLLKPDKRVFGGSFIIGGILHAFNNINIKGHKAQNPGKKCYFLKVINMSF